MRSFFPALLLMLAACGETTGSKGSGFDRSSAGAPTPTAVSQDPLSRVKPGIVASMKTGDPVPVHSVRSPLSPAQLQSLSAPALETIYKARPFTWFGGDDIAVHFKATFFLQGAISQTRVNGLDFAYLTSGTFIPEDKETIFALMAARSGCKYTGRGHVEKAVNYGNRGSRWVAPMRCE